MNYKPTISHTDSHQNAKAIDSMGHDHTKSTLTIDTYQPPDPTKPQHRMARPIITPVKPQSKANTHPNQSYYNNRCNEIDGSPTHLYPV